MENATDALYIGSAILLFLIALSIAIYSVTEVRETAQSVFSQTETVEMAQGSSGYINYIQSSDATRIVGVETVVSSMYRSIKENYVVYIKFKDTISNTDEKNMGLTPTTAYKENPITDSTESLLSTGDKIYRFTAGSEEKNHEIDSILTNGFYSQLVDKKFYEYLGEYQNNSEASEENKLTYRIITYIEKKP